jgi:hypothetical protein
MAPIRSSPLRPRITAEACLDLIWAHGFDHEQNLLAVADRDAEDDEPLGDQPLHKRRMLVPGALLSPLARTIPVRAVDRPPGDDRHDERMPGESSFRLGRAVFR